MVAVLIDRHEGVGRFLHGASVEANLAGARWSWISKMPGWDGDPSGSASRAKVLPCSFAGKIGADVVEGTERWDSPATSAQPRLFPSPDRR